MSPYIIGFYGISNAGKTTLIVQIVKKLTDEGYRVATVKQTDKKKGMDCRGKDTWKHGNAGATTVVFSSSVETDIIVRKKMSIQEIIRQITTADFYDCIVVEGARDPVIPKIRIGNRRTRKNTIKDYQGDSNELFAFIKKNIHKSQEEIVTVVVNGRQIPLTEFPSLVIKNTVIGMLQSLKGVDTIIDVDLHIRSSH